MQLAFQDFEPHCTAEAKMFRAASYESIAHVLERVNAWIVESGARVVNIETVALPNIHEKGETGTDSGLHSEIAGILFR